MRKIICLTKNIIYKVGRFLFIRGIVWHYNLYGGLKKEIKFKTLTRVSGKEFILQIVITENDFKPFSMDDFLASKDKPHE